VPRWFTEGMAVHEETAVSPEWGDRLSPDVLTAIREKKLLPVVELDRGFVHPTHPQQVIVSYFQAGRICDFITRQWSEAKLLDMLHAFGAGKDTATVLREVLAVEPAEFDKRFIAAVEADTRRQVTGFDEWRKRMKGALEMAKLRDWDGVVKEGAAIRDIYPDYVESHSVYELMAEAFAAKGNRAAATAALESYAKMGGRDPGSLKTLAKYLEEAGRKVDAAAALERLNYIYPMDGEAHARLGALWLEQGNVAGAVREFGAVVAGTPADPAAAHYNLARALRQDGKIEPAKDELLAALEIAPGYRPAQKMLLELSVKK
jgi:cellulose synthase operon protein C